jgi:large subunit ribosomal protein L31
MQKKLHPNIRKVAFKDVSSGDIFLIDSTISTEDTINFEGQQYPLHTLSLSSSSHPFYTGQQKFVDKAGRIEKFDKKFNIKRK